MPTVEGVDQTRGWFQVSLITAAATRGARPYDNVVSHGLALDELGRKMSKSLGNFEYASEVVNRIGADVFRLVFASVDYSSDMNVGENLFSAVSEAYRKIRNTCRFMLGNLADFDPARDAVAPAADARVRSLHAGAASNGSRRRAPRLRGVRLSGRLSCDSEFRRGRSQLAVYRCRARSALLRRGANSRERRSAQTALYLMLDALVRMLAPLIPFTADEIYSHIPGRTASSVHLLTMLPADTRFIDEELEAHWERLLEVRGQALKVLEAMRQAGTIGAPLDASLKLGVTEPRANGLTQTLADAQGALKDLLIVSQVGMLDEREIDRLKDAANGDESFMSDGFYGRVGSQPPLIVAGQHARGVKCERCWRYFEDSGDSNLDPRCRAVVAAQSA